MRGRAWTVAVSGLLTLSLLGCGSASSDRTATPAAPATGVCNGVAKCHVVANTDVDGDGVRDQVGFVVESKRHVVVHVKTATGQRVSRGMDVLWFPRGEFYGAAPVDGQPGSELVVGSTMGAHTTWFTTLTMRNGRLVRLDAPGREDEWMIDGSFAFFAGVGRQRHGSLAPFNPNLCWAGEWPEPPARAELRSRSSFRSRKTPLPGDCSPGTRRRSGRRRNRSRTRPDSRPRPDRSARWRRRAR